MRRYGNHVQNELSEMLERIYNDGTELRYKRKKNRSVTAGEIPRMMQKPRQIDVISVVPRLCRRWVSEVGRGWINVFHGVQNIYTETGSFDPGCCCRDLICINLPSCDRDSELEQFVTESQRGWYSMISSSKIEIASLMGMYWNLYL